MASDTGMFTYRHPVLFQHCDPAGIVFYPRYFEMMNATMEAWFGERLDCPFHLLHGDDTALTVPAVEMTTRFTAPSRHGDSLDIALRPLKSGRSSATLEFTARCGEEMRLQMTVTIVCCDKKTARPVAWPDGLRKRLEEDIARTGHLENA